VIMLPEVEEVLDAQISIACGDYLGVSVLRMFELASLLEDAAMPGWTEYAMLCAEVACRASIED
jgi:hypothetical protein